MKVWLRRVEAGALLGGSFLLALFVVQRREFVTLELGRLGFFSYPIAIALFTIVASAPFSVTDALAVMNGVIFGPVGGSIVNAIGIICAGVFGYTVALRTSALLELDRSVARLPGWVRRFRVGSLPFLIVVRVIPGLGGTLATQVAAAMRVPIVVHVFAMSVVAIPICTALAIGGDTLANAIHAHVTEPVRRYAHRHHLHIPRMPFTHPAHQRDER